MERESIPAGQASQPPPGTPVVGTSTDNMVHVPTGKTDAASVLLAPTTSFILSTPPVNFDSPSLLLNNDRPLAAADGVTAARDGGLRDGLQDPKQPLASTLEDVAKREQAEAVAQAPATAAQGRAWRRRRKSRSSRKSKASAEIPAAPASNSRKKRRTKRRKSKAAVADAEDIPANEDQRRTSGVPPLAAADVASKADEKPAQAADLQTVDAGGDGEEEQAEKSESADTRQKKVPSQAPAIEEKCVCDASDAGAVGAVDDERMSPRRRSSQFESAACSAENGKKANKGRCTVKVASPSCEEQPYHSRCRRETKAEQSPSPMSFVDGGALVDRRGRKKSFSAYSAYSYTTLQELATSLKNYTTPVRAATVVTQRNDDNDRKYLPHLLLFVAIFVSVVTLLLWFMDVRYQHAIRGLCVSPACVELSAAFDGVLNYSVDPCDDMDAFVCSKGRLKGYGATSWGRQALSVVDTIIRDYELRMVKLFTDGDTAFTASAMVADFLKVCSDVKREAPSSTDSFREFFAYVSVPWPFDPPVSAHIHPLEAVFGLSLKWGVDTWFRAYVNMVGSAVPASSFNHLPEVFIEVGSQASSFLELVRTLELIKSRERYYRFFYERYNATLPDSEEIARDLVTEKAVLTTVDEARSPGTTGPRVVVATIAKIADAVANTTLNNWLDPVIATPGGRLANSQTVVAVRDVRILRAVHNLTSTYSSDVLMRHLSWWLVQILTVISWPRGYVDIAGKEVARSEAKVECYRMMGDRFGLLMASESAVKLFDRQSREDATNFFVHIIGFLANATAKASWLSEEAKVNATKLLQDLEVVVWPPEVEESNATLSSLYSGFCSTCRRGTDSQNSTFQAESTASNSTARPLLMDYWWQFSRKFWELSPELQERMQLLWQTHKFETLHYEPWDNRIRVSHAALSNLFYYPESYVRRTTNFGGLGAAFVLSLLQVLELPARHFNVNLLSQPLTDMGDLSERAEYLNCSKEFMTNARDVFAMGLAWQALKVQENATANESVERNAKYQFKIAIKDDNRVDHLYNGDQLFFLTYCRIRCLAHRHPAIKHGPGCNAAIRGTADFGHTFKCDVGTPMVPRNACQVSDFFGAQD